MGVPDVQLWVASQIRGVPASLDSLTVTSLALGVGARQQAE